MLSLMMVLEGVLRTLTLRLAKGDGGGRGWTSSSSSQISSDSVMPFLCSRVALRRSLSLVVGVRGSWGELA